MHDRFPIPIPDRLPLRINPCPIVQAIFEVRFTTAEPWRTLPGRLSERIRDRYPQQKDLPLAQFPEELLRTEPSLSHRALMKFLGRDFQIRVGPNVLSLTTKRNAYPGWSAIEGELQWLLERVRQAEFIEESGRLRVRYIDFFEQDIFDKLILGVNIGQRPIQGSELNVAVAFNRPPFTARLRVSNAAIIRGGMEPKRGSVLDLDVWVGALDFDLFEDGLSKFKEAHLLVKQCFFGLAKPDFVASLNPTYE